VFAVVEGLEVNRSAKQQSAAMKYRHGDKVWIKNLHVEGTVVEERTRTIVVRFTHKGELEERHFTPEDLEQRPTTKEKYLEHKTP
jgi:hypothetical protein